MIKSLRLALLISGGGTTASAIIKASQQDKCKVQPCVVIASSSGISGIARVAATGFPRKNIVIIDPTKCKDRAEFAKKLLGATTDFEIDLIGQYGWLPLTPKSLIDRFEGRIINQHPGPLDPPSGVDFGGSGMWGRRVHCAALHFRKTTNHDFWTEATTHLVTAEFDKGAVIKREKVAILPDDTVESLQKRVLEVEYKVQIEALNDFAQNKVKILKRSTPLIKKSEVKILADAKRIAALLYPNG